MRKLLCIPLLLCLIGSIVQAQPAESLRASATRPFVLGEVTEIQSVQLGEQRLLNIYLPEGYAPDDTTRFPVIYLLDGSADEDFIHVAGLVQYANFPWVNLLPKSILVGIGNTDRKRDFTFPTTIEEDKKAFPTAGGSARFIAFLAEELQPFIQNHYRTNGSKTLIGQSLGGLLATEILFKKPNLFTHYIIVSPSLWWDQESLLSTPPRHASPLSVYVAVGEEGDIMEGDANRLVGILQKNLAKGGQVLFHRFSDESHATIFHLAVYRAFEDLYTTP